MRRIKGNRKRKKNWILFLLTIVFIMIFSYSFYKVVMWKMDNDKGVKTLNDIKEDIKIIKNSENGMAKYKVNFQSLKNKNSDTVAFIRVNGTNIEYPVVKTNDNSYYLTHSFDKSYNGAGWPFANYLNKFDGNDKNISIFAHARFDGSMFGTLYKTLSSDWQSNKNNYEILWMTDDNKEDIYLVFSTYKILSEDYYIQSDFTNDEEYVSFLNTLKKRSNYNYGVDVNKDSHILTLSTCASDDRYRIVLHAVKKS